MLDVTFWKVEAAGNDFVMIDYRKPFFKNKLSETAIRLTNRRLGIGADGVIFIENAPGADFFLAYYNADGSGPVMCGNGGRAALFYIFESGICRKENYHFMASDGLHDGRIKANQVALTIKYSGKINKTMLGTETVYLVDTGVPHIIRIVENIDAVDISAESPALRKKHDANINYIEKIRDGYWKIRTYERGVENETLACGTGATASAMTIHSVFHQAFPITLQARGGRLSIDSEADTLWLSGPTRKVFEGSISIEEK